MARKLTLLLVMMLLIGVSPLLPAEAKQANLTSLAPPSSQHTTNQQSEPQLTFAILSDIHIQSWHTPSHQKFTAALQDLNNVNSNTDVMILNGDLTNGMPDDYKKLKELLKKTPHPLHLFATMGNHEYYKAWHNKDGWWNAKGFPNGETEQASIRRFLDFTGEKQVYYKKVVKGYTFLFLGSERYRQSDPEHLEDAWLSSRQLDFLREALREAGQDGKPIFVFLHQPLPHTVAGTHTCCVNNRAIIQHEELKEILSDYSQVFFFTGHTHHELKLANTVVQDGFTMINTSSVYQPWTVTENGRALKLGHKESEGFYVEVYGDRLMLQGRDLYRKRWIPEAQFLLPLPQQEEQDFTL